MPTNRFILVAVLVASVSVVALGADADVSGTPAAVPGLELWLSADRQAETLLRDRVETTDRGIPLGRWEDLSGKASSAVQEDPQHQPRLVRIGMPAQTASSSSHWVVRFDGDNDHLRVLDFNRRFKDFTVFVVAAPHSNAGGFRGFMALNERGRKDYQSGFNLDMNGPPSTVLGNLNLEGRGFSGARNLMATPAAFGTLLILEAFADSAGSDVRLRVDGKPGGRREYAGAELTADEVTVGARHFENGAGPQRVQANLHGDIAEIVLFSRVLNDQETRSVRSYLNEKYKELRKALPRELKLATANENVEPLVTVADPPLAQMLVPGFVVRTLPVDLTNLNNLRYRADGKLYALGYNGNVSLLSDTDGDGLEDSARAFFTNNGRLRGPIGLAVIPPDHALLVGADGVNERLARGVIVASKGKVSALIDHDGDDVAEEERVIASGWKEIPQNVDAVGIAIRPTDGSIYFALGTAAYNNAYLLDDAGRSAFDLGSDRGTIQRISPDLSRRSTVCTGVRFAIGMDFNARNELFVTDQEGATWLPDGNPFDELLHIRPGIHYGFPPRHPQHLPNVFDHPSVFDYGPQHQSTCGMVFNLPLVEGGPIFGPKDWRGDAIVTGESRGKLYRTQLVRDRNGEYVASNQLIGCLSMLTVDCCLTPRGDLLVACHSGGPDWGTGPEGRGKVLQIRYEGRQTPQPTAVWAAGEHEVRIGFDRPLDPSHLKQLAAKTKISYGEYVAAGDRFESIRPGYAVTQLQQSKPRYSLAVYSAGVSPDRTTLILSTAKHPAAVQYAIKLPGLLERATLGSHEEEQAQHTEIDLAYSLGGVQASWEPVDQTVAKWTGQLPHLDLDLASQFLRGQDRERLAQLLTQPGTLTLTTQLDTRGLFTPTVQPGSKRGYELEDDRGVPERSIDIEASAEFSLIAPGSAVIGNSGDGAHRAVVAFGLHDPPTLLTLKVATGNGDLSIAANWRVTLKNGTVHRGPLALRRFVLPWADVDLNDASFDTRRTFPELASSSWGRGRRVFMSNEAGCSKCHVAHGSGGQVGPDLSNLIHRDYASVRRDIAQPSFAINPDFITYLGVLRDGRTISGAIRSDGDRLLFGDKDGKVTEVKRRDIENLTASAVSIMPDGIEKTLGPERMNDLLAFLLTKPPTMPLDSPLTPPPSRKRSDVVRVLQGAPTSPSPESQPQESLKSLDVLLVAGKKDHGPGEHDYPAWLHSWGELLRSAAGMSVSTAMEWPTGEQIQKADTIVFFQKGSWNDERAEAIDAHLAKGGGLVYIHWAVEAGEHAPAFAQRIGLASQSAKLRYRHGPLELGFETGRSHPIGRNFNTVHFHDESYWLMQGDSSRINIIGTGVEDGEPRPLFWTFEPSHGRVFVSIPGHYSWTFDDPLFRVLLLRGIAWSAREPVDRLNDLVPLGVQFAN
ncbi:MAG: hypothetical protein GY903_27220 [Fuerstiella sp.]|nr:hypothetical protein [Fuerstiella sp.]